MSTIWQPLQQLCALISGTLVSEDLTSIAAGLLIRQGQLGWGVGVLGCFLGILLGDLGLFALGRLAGAGVQRGGRFLGWLNRTAIADSGRWFERRGWLAIIASRFMPGTRVPLYIAAGMLGKGFWRFAAWCALAAAVWTPLVVVGVALFGQPVVEPLYRWLGPGFLGIFAAALGLLLAARLVTQFRSASGRARAVATVSRIWQWEFWPAWLFYLPLLPYLAWLTVRYRSFTVWTLANPGIPDGGVVGESKADILAQLPRRWTVPTLLLSAEEPTRRLARFEEEVAWRGWSFPLILKPDASQRGAGVRRVKGSAEVAEYLCRHSAALIVQPYHPGPYEAGIFYYRVPGETSGHILSITDKRFPVVSGDGKSTLEELILAHPRYRMQAGVFLQRHTHDRKRVLALDEKFTLAVAGNHCQGTMFLDGGHLITPALERTVDAIAQAFPGFYFGRFDVRYGDAAAFKAGLDLAIVELNGVTSESTIIYDPSRSLGAAYRTLYEQWGLLFQIGNLHRLRGIQPNSIWKLLSSVRRYYQDRPAALSAD